MATSNNFNNKTESAGYIWLNSAYLWWGGEGMQVEWNQCDGLSLATDRRMTHKTLVTFFNMYENQQNWGLKTLMF